MLGNFRGKPIDLQCSQAVLPEFPEMLFGVTTTEGAKISYFNASYYINKKHLPSNTVTNFIAGYGTQLKQLCQSYNINQNIVVRDNKQGEKLIESHFQWLFLSFVEPDFLAYTHERIQEMYHNGFCISDWYIEQAYNFRIGGVEKKTNDERAGRRE